MRRTGDNGLPGAGAVRSLLDVDPELADGITPEDRARARRLLLAPMLAIPAGRWPERRPDASFGLLLVDGVVCREVSLGDRRSLELLGGGDVMQLPSPAPDLLGDGTRLTAITDVTAVLLGTSFISAAANWPSVLSALIARIDAQRERLAIQGLIAHLPRAEHRLLLALWHLASRFGRVTADGTVIPLYLSHDLIGQLIAARRSTASLAIRNAMGEGWLSRRPDGSWVLGAEAADRAAALGRTRTARSTGETLMVRQRSGETLHAALSG